MHAFLDGVPASTSYMGRFVEDVDPPRGAALGNVPQAFAQPGSLRAAVDSGTALERTVTLPHDDMTAQLTDKIAIVTGSDSGIGRATAEAFAQQGADVVITYYSDADGAAETRRRVQAAGRRALVVQLDQTQPQEVERLFRETREQLGPPDILVNNAGVDSTGDQVADMPLEDWDRVIRPTSTDRSIVADNSSVPGAKWAAAARSSTSPQCTKRSRAPDRPATTQPKAVSAT